MAKQCHILVHTYQVAYHEACQTQNHYCWHPRVQKYNYYLLIAVWSRDSYEF